MPDGAPERSEWLRATGVLAALGATVGTALDAIHTHTDTLAYPEPAFFREAWWVPPLFAAAGVAIGLARPLWERLLRLRSPPPSGRVVVLGIGLFVLAYALSGLLPFPWPTRSLVLAAVAAVAWTVCDRTGLGIFLAVSTALLGTSVEIGLVRVGAFAYAPDQRDLAGVAGWLPWLYASASIAVGALGKRLTDGAPASPS